jgi:hypothetical protein
MKLTPHFKALRPCRALVSLAFAATVWVAAALTSSTASAAGLNDTGQTTCANAAGSTVSCTDITAVPGQDARYGRDAAAGTSALTKVGNGANGFDFTKISNAGAALPATAPLGAAPGEWGCTRDNTTGLMWEVKTAAAGLRQQDHRYSWYNSNPSTNGGAVGTANGGTCFAAGRCDIEKFVQDVNAATMCGKSDWRMPSYRELQGLVKLGSYPTIDPTYFPNTPVLNYFWSGSPYAGDSSLAWYVYFVYGNSYSLYRYSGNYARLVRVGQ